MRTVDFFRSVLGECLCPFRPSYEDDGVSFLLSQNGNRLLPCFLIFLWFFRRMGGLPEQHSGCGSGRVLRAAVEASPKNPAADIRPECSRMCNRPEGFAEFSGFFPWEFSLSSASQLAHHSISAGKAHPKTRHRIAAFLHCTFLA
jgi:hypothetical protein